jgi:hypothetical protein
LDRSIACCIAAQPVATPQSTPRVLLDNRTSGTGCIAAQPATMHRPAASLHRQAHAAASVAAQCVRSAAQLGTARPYTPASAFWDCAHRSPPDWARSLPHLHRDQVHPPPTSATRLIRSLAHLCTAAESIPAPTSAPQLNPSPAHICTAAESIPRRHLRHHCCPPGHLPLRNTSV